MNLNQLKVFYLTAKHGSLSAAAESLYITQPAVTKGIQRLQEHYEIKLFNRFGKKMALTDAGEVLEDSYQIIVPPGHPFAAKSFIEPEDLAGHTLIVHEKGSAPRRSTEEYIRRHNISVSIPLELSNNEAVKTAVEEGLGVAVITRRVVSKEIAMGSLKAIPLSDPAMTRKFYLIHHKDKYISRSLQSLIDMVDQWVEEYRLGLH